jgi:GAF domain-containing protein
LAFNISSHAADLVSADRCTIYICDYKHNQLVSIASDSHKDVRISLTAGLIGYVAETGVVVNTSDAYGDSRFLSECDIKYGYRTKSLLVVPIWDSTKTNTIGLIEAKNKLEFTIFEEFAPIIDFDEKDVDLIRALCDIIGPKIEQTFSSVINKESAKSIDVGAVNFQSEFGTRNRSSTVPLPPGAIREEEEDDN